MRDTEGGGKRGRGRRRGRKGRSHEYRIFQQTHSGTVYDAVGIRGMVEFSPIP